MVLFVAVVAIIAAGAALYRNLQPLTLDGYTPLLVALATAAVCAAVVGLVLAVFPREGSLSGHTRQEIRQMKKERVTYLKPASALIAVVCLALSAAGYLVCCYALDGGYDLSRLLSAQVQAATDSLAASQPSDPSSAGASAASLAGNDAVTPVIVALSSVSPSYAVLRIVVFVLMCTATAFYEEGLFRIIIQRVFEALFAKNGTAPARCVLHAALLTSIVFGVLHLSAPFDDLGNAHAVAQIVLKLLQGTMFGLVMTGLLKRTGSMVFIVALHACYDLALFFPTAISFGVVPNTYITGLPIDTVALAVSVVPLIPAAIGAVRALTQPEVCERRFEGEL